MKIPYAVWKRQVVQYRECWFAVLFEKCRTNHFLYSVKRRVVNFLRTSAELWNGLRQLKSSDVVELQHLQHFLGLRINLNNVVLQSRNLRNIVVSAFPLFLLQFDGNTTYLTMPKPLHKVSDKSRNLVA